MKSHESRLTSLARVIYYDACAKCTASTLPEERDLDVLRSRVEKEGLSFLTITLPSLGQDFERCLEQGKIVPGLFRSFRKRLKTPAFLRGFFGLIFDTGTGDILDDPSIGAIEGIRQLAYSFKKLKLPCTQDRVSKALKGFIQCEQDLQEDLPQTELENFSRVSTILWGSILPGKVSLEDLRPKHGPGATVERIKGNLKYVHQIWHDRLEPYFPLFHFAYSSENAYESEEFQKLSIVDCDSESPVRVITVPKTLKGPRIIAIEPVCMQYTQQAVAQELIKTLESAPVTAGHINFSDQSVNRSIALTSSLDGRLATLDLSSASDRVPLSLALNMFDCVPDFRDAIDACRSRKADVPKFGVIELEKFASMGSALCFPIEAMYFFTLCVMASLEHRKLPVTYGNIVNVAKHVYVYGDDICVPVDMAETVVNTLQRYYCKVNTAKSFWVGKFRESCGMDAYLGEEVTPTYLRETQPDNRQQASALISWVETSNLFYKKGYWKTAAYMIDHVQTILGVLPIVGEQCAGLGKFSFQCTDSNLVCSQSMKRQTVTKGSPKISRRSKVRWNSSYHVLEIKAWAAAPRYQNDIIEGYPALMKCLLRLLGNHTPINAEKRDHLRETARYGSVTLKSRWVRPY